MMSTDAWSSLEIQSWSSQLLTLHSCFETAKALTFIDFAAISILIVRRPQNASLMRKTQKTIDLLVFDGESNGVCLEKHHIFHKHIVFFMLHLLVKTSNHHLMSAISTELSPKGGKQTQTSR